VGDVSVQRCGALAASDDDPGREDPGQDLLQGYLQDRPGLDAHSVTVVPLSGDASTRRYFRAVWPAGVSSVLALYPQGFAGTDLPFLTVQALLERWQIPVPRVLQVDAARGIVELEDLGDLTLQSALCDATDTERKDHYGEAVEGILRLQQEASRTASEAECFRLAFDPEKLGYELRFFVRHFLEGLRQVTLSAEDRSRCEEGIVWLGQEIACWPRVLCHRDFHSRNLMVHGGRLVWIDFEDARMGPDSYDLVSLLRDSYVDLPEALVEELLEDFRLRATSHLAPETFRRRFELMSVQRNLKALGTFGFMATVRCNRNYLSAVPRTLAHLRRNLARHPELLALHRVLATHVEELS
jgi:aminoglycoside/choline kinase family phosphotransferase